MTLTSNNHAQTQSSNSPTQPGKTPLGGLLPVPGRRKPQSVGGKELVLMEFQRTSLELTRKFLETQERVMLAYLQGTVGQLSARNEDSGSFEFMRTLAASLEPQYEYEPPIQVLPSEPLSTLATVSVPLATPSIPCGESTFDYREPAASPALKPEPLSTPEAMPALELSPEQLIEALVEIVSQRTGYPPEMLDPSLDLEADLGIDSIKRVEILNSFRKLLPESAQNSLEDGIEKLASVKTLQGIMDWIKNDMGKLASPASEPGLTETELTALAGT